MSQASTFPHQERIAQAPHLATAYEDACKRLAIDPSPSGTDEQILRERVAKAIVNAAKLGVSDRAVLSDLAVAFGSARAGHY